MATSALRKVGLNTSKATLPPAAKRGPQVAQSRSRPSPVPGAGNQATYRALQQSQRLPPTPTPGTTSVGGQTDRGRTPKPLQPISPDTRARMAADVDRIAALMKSWILETSDQIEIIGLIDKWARLDDEVHADSGQSKTPNLDHVLMLLKSRTFTRRSVKSLGVEQWAILYDALWYRLSGYWLNLFEGYVNRSATQKTTGAGDKDVENGAALIAQQEAMGLWGTLKGMGIGLVGIAGPKASQWIGEQFDETGRILFDHEWDNAEPLVWGMNAGQIGTAGGDVIWQLVTFARGGGASKAGKIWALIDKLRKLVAVGAGLQGVYLGGEGIARAIEKRQKLGLSLEPADLLHDNDLLDALAILTSSAISTVLAAKGGPGTKAQAIDRVRLQLLLSQLHVATAIARLSEIAVSDRSPEEKEREYGAVMTSLIPQIVGAAIDAAHYQHATNLPEATAPPEGQQRALPSVMPQDETTALPAAHEREKKAPPTMAAKVEETSELARKMMHDPTPQPKTAPTTHLLESEGGQTVTGAPPTPAAAATPAMPTKPTAKVFIAGDLRDVPRQPEVVKGHVGSSQAEFSAEPAPRPDLARLVDIDTGEREDVEHDRHQAVAQTFAESEQAALNPVSDRFGVQRGPSVDEAQRRMQEQDDPSVEGIKRAKRQESHATGLEAKALAKKQGIALTDWDNPESHRGDFGRGIDGVGERNGKQIIVEYKGESSKLERDQMSNAWVGRKIAQLEILNDPMAETLLHAANQNKLQGVVYNTRDVVGEPMPRRLARRSLRSTLPNTKISEQGLIQYNANRVQKAYRAELNRLAAKHGLVRDLQTGKWRSQR